MESPRRREGSGVLKEEKRTNIFFFKPRADDCTTKQLILLKDIFSLKLCRKKESEVAQLCLTLCDPTDCSLPGSSVHGIFQARVLEWGAIAFSASAYTAIYRFNDALLTIILMHSPPMTKELTSQ